MKTSRYFKKVLRLILLLTGLILILQYVVNLKYQFPEATPFSGNSFYNPYENIDTTQWRKANFHVHTHQWLGLTNGRRNSSELVDSLYRYLGYDIYNISDYQRINNYEKNNSWYMPVYEHGYTLSKNHHIVLNAKKVRWLDYFFPQTLDNKQQVINRLKKDTSSVVAIAHPHLQDKYMPEDFIKLCGYDLIEVLNQNRFSLAYWDSALSGGHPAFILADDDAHDLRDISEGGHCLTFINTALQKDSILTALKKGCAYGADVNGPDNDSYEQRKIIIQQLPVLKSVAMHQDTLTIRMSANVQSFNFIGQHGISRKKVHDVEEATYVFSPNDTYIRAQLTTREGTVYYLNPVFRYDGSNVPKYSATVDVMKTWTWRIAFVLAVVGFVLIRKRINS